MLVHVHVSMIEGDALYCGTSEYGYIGTSQFVLYSCHVGNNRSVWRRAAFI